MKLELVAEPWIQSRAPVRDAGFSSDAFTTIPNVHSVRQLHTNMSDSVLKTSHKNK